MTASAIMITEGNGQRLTRRVTAITIILFWIGQFSILTISRLVFRPGDDVAYILPRLLVTLAGVGLSFAIAAVHRRTRGVRLASRLIATIAAALAAAILHALINFGVFHLFDPAQNWREAAIGGYALAVLQWFWAYAALAGLLLAVTYSAELHEHERRAALLEREAHSAHLRALRYQLNPHFMFNTLNSIASLISAHEVGLAERMVENLSDFLRAGLAIDPNEDIPFGREIELQSLYLAIEAVRFPNRLVVEIDVPAAARAVPVPSLIIQPLVENAVRHAVAASTEPVTLLISAREEAGWLAIRVVNTRGNGRERRNIGHGTGVGLTNVAERLEARYGDDCGFTAGRDGEGGFAVTFRIPLTGAE